MKLVLTKERFSIPSNLTDGELALWVRNEFPNISGSLAEMLRRFEDGRDSLCDNCVEKNSDDFKDQLFHCPKCGTELKIKD